MTNCSSAINVIAALTILDQAEINNLCAGTARYYSTRKHEFIVRFVAHFFRRRDLARTNVLSRVYREHVREHSRISIPYIYYANS